jgi:hypothetical protein
LAKLATVKRWLRVLWLARLAKRFMFIIHQTAHRHFDDKGASDPKAKKSLQLEKQSSFNWSSAGFSKVVKKEVPASTRSELGRTAVLACALDYRPLSFVWCEGFQLLAQPLIETGAKYPHADALCSTVTVENFVQQSQYLLSQSSS